MAMIHCRKCGKKISDSADSCPKCSGKNSSSVNSPKSAFELVIPFSDKSFERMVQNLPPFLQKLCNQYPIFKWILMILTVIGSFVIVYGLFKFLGLWSWMWE